MSEDPPPGKPDIMLMLHESLPDDFEADFRAQSGLAGPNIMVIRQPGGPYAGVELYLPTAVALFIAVGFFNGFLQEAGKDAYIAFKEAATALWQRTGKLTVTNIGSEGKVSPNRRFSLSYSITGEVVPGLNFKLLLQTELDAENAKAGIDAFFELIDNLLNDRVAESDVEALLTYRPLGGIVLVTFDPNARKIIPVNAFED